MGITKVSPPLAVSAGATSVSGSGTLVFSNSNGLTFGLSGSTLTGSVQTNYQSTGNYLTTAALSQDSSRYAGTGFTSTTTAGTAVVGTHNTAGLSLGVPAYLTTAALSQDSSKYAGTGFTSTTTAGTAIVGTHNTAGLSLGVPAYLTAAGNNFSAGVSTGGNTSGNTGVTGTRIVLAGGNNITVSQGTDANGATITISGANAGGAQTGISGVVVSDTTYTSGTVSFSNQNNVTIGSSVNGGTQYIRLSVGNYITTARASTDAVGLNTAQTNVTWTVNSSGVSLNAGGYAGTGFTSTTTAGTAVVGTQNTAGLSLGVPAYLTTADLSANSSKYVQNWKLTGNTAGTTSSAQGTDLWLAGGNGVTISGSSNTLSFSVAAQTNQSAIKGLGASNTGNTAGNTGVSTGIDWVFAGTNNITISESTAGGGPNTLWISGPSVAGAQTGISGIQVSDTTYTSGTVTFRNANGISFGSSGAQGISASYTVPSLTSWTVSDAATSATVGRLAFTNSNGLTLSLSTSNNGNHTVIGSYTVPTVTNSSLTMQAGGSTLSSVSRIAFVDSNGVSFGASTSNNGSITITATVRTDYLTSQSTQFQAATLGGNTAGTTTFNASNNATLWLNGGNGITLSGNGSTITISGVTQSNQSAIKGFGASNTGNTAGNTGLSTGIDWVLAGTNGITISESTAGGGPNTLWVSGVTTAAQTNQTEGVYLTGNTTAHSSSSTYNATALSISAAGNLSIGWNSAASQLVLSGGTAAVGSLSFYASSNTTSSTSGTGAGTISMAGAGAISIAATNSGFIVSSPVTSSLSATGWVSLSTNGSTISIGASATQSLYAVGNTFGTSSGTGTPQTLSISGAGPISVAASNSGFVISGDTNSTVGFWQNYEWDAALSATSTFGLSTGFFVPVAVPNTIQWNNVGMIVSASVPTTSCGNTISVSFGTSGQSLQVDHFYSFTNSGLYDLYLLSRGAGGSSTDLVTMSSTRNSIVTFLNETFRANATAGNASQTVTVSNSVSLGVSFPAMTSATSTSVNAATTVTLWGTGYSSWASTASGSTTSSKTTAATMSVSIGSTWPATTVWSSNKFLQMNWGAGVVNPGLYWVGIVRGSSTSSSSSSASTSGAAGRSYTTSINFSDLTMTAQVSYAGVTNTIASSLGTFGGNSLASLAFEPGHGTYSATYAGNKTFMNNAGQANGEIALSDIGTVTSFFKPWYQFNSNRV